MVRMAKEFLYSLMRRLPDWYSDLIHGIWDFRCIRLIVEPLLDKIGIEYSPEDKYNTTVNSLSEKHSSLINV